LLERSALVRRTHQRSSPLGLLCVSWCGKIFVDRVTQMHSEGCCASIQALGGGGVASLHCLGPSSKYWAIERSREGRGARARRRRARPLPLARGPRKLFWGFACLCVSSDVAPATISFSVRPHLGSHAPASGVPTHPHQSVHSRPSPHRVPIP
jgi:hypothetical protein